MDLFSSPLKTDYEGLRFHTFYPNLGTNERHYSATGRTDQNTKTISSLSKYGRKTSSLRSSLTEDYPGSLFHLCTGQINGRGSELRSNSGYGANPINSFKSEGTSNVGKLSGRFRCIMPTGQKGREICF